jgi:predicted small lipoprotein YifL
MFIGMIDRSEKGPLPFPNERSSIPHRQQEKDVKGLDAVAAIRKGVTF